jgi:hypothetical protein
MQRGFARHAGQPLACAQHGRGDASSHSHRIVQQPSGARVRATAPHPPTPSRPARYGGPACAAARRRRGRALRFGLRARCTRALRALTRCPAPRCADAEPEPASAAAAPADERDAGDAAAAPEGELEDGEVAGGPAPPPAAGAQAAARRAERASAPTRAGPGAPAAGRGKGSKRPRDAAREALDAQYTAEARRRAARFSACRAPSAQR